MKRHLDKTHPFPGVFLFHLVIHHRPDEFRYIAGKLVQRVFSDILSNNIAIVLYAKIEGPFVMLVQHGRNRAQAFFGLRKASLKPDIPFLFPDSWRYLNFSCPSLMK